MKHIPCSSKRERDRWLTLDGCTLSQILTHIRTFCTLSLSLSLSHTHTPSHTHTHTYAPTCTHTHICTLMHTHTHTHTHTCTHTHSHTQSLTHTLTHSHIQCTHTFGLLFLANCVINFSLRTNKAVDKLELCTCVIVVHSPLSHVLST